MSAVHLSYDRYSGPHPDGDKGGERSVPIVILHGLFGSKRNWRSTARRLTQTGGFDILVPDLRHHGDSPKEGVFTFDEMAEDIAAFIETAAGGSAVLLGHSVGGKAAVRTEMRFPEQVAGLILADITPFELPGLVCEELSLIAEALDDLPISGINTRREAEEFLQPRIGDPGVVSFLLQNLRKSASPETIGYEWQIGLQAIRDNFGEICGAVLPSDDPGKVTAEGKGLRADTSCLCIRGEASPFFPPEDAERLKLYFHDLEVTTISGTGHWLHVEKQDEFVDRVSDFMRSRDFFS